MCIRDSTQTGEITKDKAPPAPNLCNISCLSGYWSNHVLERHFIAISRALGMSNENSNSWNIMQHQCHSRGNSEKWVVLLTFQDPFPVFPEKITKLTPCSTYYSPTWCAGIPPAPQMWHREGNSSTHCQPALAHTARALTARAHSTFSKEKMNTPPCIASPWSLHQVRPPESPKPLVPILKDTRELHSSVIVAPQHVYF